ncbi:MAG: response regulator [Carboxylicivirga sp.]|nr:response regulator [Carboxylicivirga sp.]
MQTLVNQLLEFRRSETGEFTLSVNRGDIVYFVEGICSNFNSLANNKNIDFKFVSYLEDRVVYYDSKIIESILTNLLSNAFKFTPNGGEISLDIRSIKSDVPTIQISVKDSGIGISQEHQAYIFDRFYQVEGQYSDGVGSGIGLSLVKNLVEIQNGSIHINSEKNKGSEFIVKIPVGKHFDKEDKVLEKAFWSSDTECSGMESDTDFKRNDQKSEIQQNTKVLIIEDNKDLLNYLKFSLGKNYIVETACNGEEGWRKIKNLDIEIIVSDVMMPVMDGLKLCKLVKEDFETSHIPIILLTARSGNQNIVKGLEQGADIYLEKPFNSEILEAHLQNLIILKKKWQHRFEKDLGIEINEVTRSNRDEEFLKKAIAIVYENISNTDFKVSNLNEQSGVSRTLLHMKLKELTGMSASEFIKGIRLKEAARLLCTEDIKVSEVVDQTGFSDMSYFARCFKNQFGITPKAYQQEKVKS